MPEYKELERSILARMFRAGIIDAFTFKTRIEALNYNPADVEHMLRLEQKEAVKTVLWDGKFEPNVVDVAAGAAQLAFSAVVDSTNVLYFTCWYNVEVNPFFGRGVYFEQLNAAGTVVSRYPETGYLTKTIDTFSVAKHELAVKTRLVSRFQNRPGEINTANMGLGRIEAVVS